MSNKNEPYIVADNLCYTYLSSADTEKPAALSGVSLTVNRGEFLAVIGRNGSGKSTLAKLMTLILEPSSGRLLIDGREINGDMTDEEVLALRRKVGMVFQNPDNQLIATVVEEDIAFGLENLGVPPEEIRTRVDSALEALGLTALADFEPSRLSGGQKQRVAIAGVLALMPECIIFDESTAMLDPIGRRDVLDIMKRLSREHGLTVINITHLMDEAAAADRIIVLNRGKCLGTGTPREIFCNRELIDEAGLDAPQCVRLCRMLGERDLGIGECITPEECAEKVSDILSRGGERNG